MKRIFIIAGPNGSGKTTTALALQPDLLHIYEFINADEIAKGLAPLNPESVALQASKLMILRLRELLAAKKSFAFETTGAGMNYIKYLREAKKMGYDIHLLYLWLHSADLAVQRVAHRVAEGGHHIAEEVIRRRYTLGLKNIVAHYLPIAHTALILDNSTGQQNVVASKSNSGKLDIKDKKIWAELSRC